MGNDLEGGLDLTQPDRMSELERARFESFYLEHKGTMLPGHEFWMEHDPGAMKRYRRFAIEMNAPASREYPQVAVLCWLHFYAVVGFEDGIAYQIRNAQVRGGASRAEILATLQIAFLHSGPLGTRYVASGAQSMLSDYEDPEPIAWPPGWTVEPQAFRAGLDYTQPGLDEAERAALRGWYEALCGEVPAGVELLLRYRPEALKAYRMRFEHAAAGPLPKQLFGLLLLQWQLTRGSAAGVREALSLARGLGTQRDFALDAVTRAMIYAGLNAASCAAEAADVLDSWPLG